MSAFAFPASLNMLSLPLSLPQHVPGHIPTDCNNPLAEPLRPFQFHKLPARCRKSFLGGVLGQVMIHQNRISHG
jgi:hypothetical protein